MNKQQLIESLKTKKRWSKSEVIHLLQIALSLHEWYLVEGIAYRIRMMFYQNEEMCDLVTWEECQVWYDEN